MKASEHEANLKKLGIKSSMVNSHDGFAICKVDVFPNMPTAARKYIEDNGFVISRGGFGQVAQWNGEATESLYR
jgi:hypothetical protein